MATLRETASRIETGSVILARRIGHALTPEGRPVLAIIRIGAACLTVPPLYAAIERSPLILAPLAVGIWCRRAWHASAPAPIDPEQTRRQLIKAVLELIGDRPGIHLSELYPRLLASPYGARLDETRLRAALTDARITIHRSMRVGDVEGRSGIKRTDLEALLRPAPLSPVPDPSPTDGDAGQATPESGGERAGERAESA
ncbi:hypothetical protein [Streptomyces rapamycinicus]|uniref:Uncharacterized protein n=2 Tax=Streptomyces rapamycinicus TaxID=1226757 RepID=A0A0A0NG05_STRRN|nr:hypothetical protein [Streptomyces rapamycinicus]AGP56176.1 hypothetical protein M271_23315 [Streptomyces rapamycinicus NRRL 5491]MBB4783783.1 hypothetical protein [Streptomyces rapamycinicus]RLV80746.1 hypothetical protein D3C57_120215 [Streptomyces rapamycinicus NRRL 5491]UTO64140.1 hypothetical protein LJB45_18610 [Streptomyces rapamycinicus]UTP32095.1 hypothetical protein LIV37_23730 [Streptomyces rapamycinicus NRRL 5491]